MKSVAQASCTPVMPREAIRVAMAGRICSYWAAARSSLALSTPLSGTGMALRAPG